MTKKTMMGAEHGAEMRPRPPVHPRIRPCVLFSVINPEGDIAWTTLSTSQEECVEEWLASERDSTWMINLCRATRDLPPVCTRSWELYEADGYRVVPIRLGPAPDVD